jgi:hypothetical protein
MKTIFFILSFGLAFTLTSCGKSNPSSNLSANSSQNPATLADGWKTNHSQSPDGSVQIDQSHIEPDQLLRVRNQYERANLIQLPVDAKYNANVLRITDATIEDYRHKAFIAPKLYSYGTQQGGKLAPLHHADGTVTLAFNVAFLDGITHQIITPASDSSTIDVPRAFTIAYPEELKSLLQSEYGADNGLAPLPGCPKRLTLIAAGKEYDATPSDMASGDFCQLNVPITVSLTLPEDDAKMIMEVALYSHTVDLRAIYETKVSYPTSTVSVKFDRSKIYDELKAELGIKAYYVDADVKLATTKVVEDQLMQVMIQGQTSDLLNRLIEKVTAVFFEPWAPNPSSTTNPCGVAEPVCLRFSSTTLTQSNTLEFSWAEETNLLSGQNYLTTTKLKPTPNMVEIGNIGSCNLLAFGECNRLTNDGVARETGLTVVSGNQVVLTPELMIRERRSNPEPQTTRANQNVCLKTKESCFFMTPPTLFCKQICVQSDDHWVDTINYSEGRITPDVITSPDGQMNELFDGLAFQFRFTDQRTRKIVIKECPLSDFPREGDGSMLSMRVQNTPSCSPFTNVEGETPMLYLVNHISFPENYLSGARVTRWDGTLISTPVSNTFYPKVDFAGTISIQGYSFESEH